MTVATIGILVLAGIGLWLFGGVFLRIGGIVLVFVGAVSLITTGDAFAIVVALLGFALWLAGHWHFALRHHQYKSPLAERVFLQVLPPRLDPTRTWATPVTPAETRPAPDEERPDGRT